ncbi:hypothetical protein NW755_013561 [Fusarium falciforme]|uniref:Uncharacterized protein n=1 Tax=Fusarium falciforme TaxID=195108 RepID=A0A9W8QVN6_9HYPO|nr:hypothetical protein NW755_013561 [Fusarium falciforme]
MARSIEEAPVRKPAGCIRLGAVDAYNSRGGGVQGSRVQRRGPGCPRRVGVREPSPEPEPVVDAEPVAAGSPSSFPESEYESNSRSFFESSGSDEVARGSHKCVPCRRVLLLLVKALQFALDVDDPTRDQKKHTANLCRALKTQMKVLDEGPSFFEPIVNGRIDFGLDATEKDCLLVTQVDGAPSAPIDGTGVDSAAEADRVKRMLSDAVNEMVS